MGDAVGGEKAYSCCVAKVSSDGDDRRRKKHAVLEKSLQ